MKKFLTISFVIIVCFVALVSAQIPTKTLVQIVKAEDELRFDKTLEDLLKSENPQIRKRAVLASGRIGDERAIAALAKIVTEPGDDPEVRAMAAFALGEIESIKGADAILTVLKDDKTLISVKARAVEAAGKIAAANSKEEKSKILGEAILDRLEYQYRQKTTSEEDRLEILLGITAALRAKPVDADNVLAKFLTHLDSRIRADAANALARLRVKNINEKFRAMLLTDDDPIARANAARALGAAEDKDAVTMLIEAATTDADLRVRINAIRSLGSLKSEKSADKLLEWGEKLLADYKKSEFANPFEKNELLDIATALGRILEKTKNERAIKLLDELIALDEMRSAPFAVARVKISQKRFRDFTAAKPKMDSSNLWQTMTLLQLLGEVSDFEDTGEGKKFKKEAEELLRSALKGLINVNDKKSVGFDVMALPNMLGSFAKYKTVDLSEILVMYLAHPDLFVRTTAAGLLGEQDATEENIKALQSAFAKSLLTDRVYNDAQLAILSALVKLDKTKANAQLNVALNHYDFLLRRHAANLIRENDLQKDFSDFEKKVGMVRPYNKKNKSKLGQILNKNRDYKRAVSRKNGKVQAILTTEKGKITIDLLPEDAPLTVDNFIKLANSGYFNNVAIHRVVPNFVVQDGDPLGNGSGGPGWQIRDEMNTVPYERGAVGMALSGPDTGGSQWFVTHSPQPHLDGGYTVFGSVNEIDMKIVDILVRGDKILKVEIFEK